MCHVILFLKLSFDQSSDEEEDESVARGVVQASVGVVVGMACTVIAQKTTGLISGPQKQQELTNADNVSNFFLLCHLVLSSLN